MKTVSAAIYARFSTDKQDRSSIEDQTRTCRTWAKNNGLAVVAEFADEATSGSVPVTRRTGGGAMHAAALAGQFDVLILEGLDRLSRDQVDQEQVVRRLEHRGIRLVGISDGYDSNSGESRFMLRGMRGIVNEVYRRDLPPKIRRGLAGQIARGFHAGGMSYGYRSVPVGMNDRGEADGFRLEVIPEQAAIVREIFSRYAAGQGMTRIAADLNARGVPGPGRKKNKPNTWSATALYGTPRAGSGLLNNELYIGRYVWNRREWVKDPDNPMRRVPRMRPPTEWHVADRPDLRIVDDEAWKAVRARMEAPRQGSGHRGRGGAPRTLFGGLLRCGHCGGPMIAVHTRYYGCAAHKTRGSAICQGTSAPRAETDRRLIQGLRDEVLAPAAIAKISARVKELLRDLQKRAGDQTDARDERIAALEGEIGRLTDAVAQMGLSAALRTRLVAAEAELAELTAKATGRQTSPVACDGEQVGARIRKVALRLEQALATDVEVARRILGERLGDIRVEERDDGIYAQMDIGPVLLEAVGADVSRSGCGGKI
ncbi:MAG: recombinase family protein [Betaproteobacteria bacterium]|nr:recombinase family protein [Betaproteobacteria bacterium]